MPIMIQLYSYFRSSCSYRVRIGLNLKGLEFETLPIHLVKNGGEQFSDDFKKHNPSGKVPVLVDQGQSYFQSTAILEYLDEVYPQVPLYPLTPKERAEVRMLCEVVNSDIQPLQNLRVLKSLVGDFGLSDAKKLEWIRKWISQGFESLEASLQKTAGTFAYGEKPGAVDCFLVPQVYNARRFEIDMGQFPIISRVDKACLELEAFQKAHPDNQIDTPK